jgi:hypothetical protein
MLIPGRLRKRRPSAKTAKPTVIVQMAKTTTVGPVFAPPPPLVRASPFHGRIHHSTHLIATPPHRNSGTPLASPRFPATATAGRFK